MYTYKAIVTGIYDGDTITVDIDQGFNDWQKGEKIRLFGIDAPEMRRPEREQGIIARDWLRKQILGKTIILKTHKDKKGKYGRWLGEVFRSLDSEKSLNDEMVDLGLAEAADY